MERGLIADDWLTKGGVAIVSNVSLLNLKADWSKVDLCIMDEAQAIKNPGAKRTQKRLPKCLQSPDLNKCLPGVGLIE